MAAIDRAKAHFADFGVQSMEVPEWGDESGPLVIFWQPLTLAEKQKLHNLGEANGYVARLADCLVMKALDAQGKPIFTIDDKVTLRRAVDPDVIARVVTRMMASPGAKEMGNG